MEMRMPIMAAGVEKMWKTDWLMYMNEMQMQDGIMTNSKDYLWERLH